MANKIEVSTLIEDLMRHQESYEIAAEDIRQALNNVIAKHKLHPSVVLSLLASLSAVYIHQTQKLYDKACAEEVVEEAFHNMLEAQLTDLDMRGIEIEKIKNEILN